MSKKIFEKALEYLNNGENVALVMLTESVGSAPGAKDSTMLVGKNGRIQGTIGGGVLEYKIITQTIEALDNGSDFSFDFGLTEKEPLGMVCGGAVKGYVKIFRKNKKLLIFGAGHVGQSVAQICKLLDFDVFVIDDRIEFQSLTEFSQIKQYLVCEPLEAIDKLAIDSDTYIVIATRGHEIDFEILQKTICLDHAYLGMLGSKRKINKLLETLRSEGVSEECIEKLHAPIGLNISNGTVMEIGFAIVAEILQVKNNKLPVESK